MKSALHTCSEAPDVTEQPRGDEPPHRFQRDAASKVRFELNSSRLQLHTSAISSGPRPGVAMSEKVPANVLLCPGNQLINHVWYNSYMIN